MKPYANLDELLQPERQNMEQRRIHWWCRGRIRIPFNGTGIRAAGAVIELDPIEAMWLLASVSYGRVMLTRHALRANLLVA